MQLVPWTQEKEEQEPDAPCVRLDIAAVNQVVFGELKLSWDELDFIGIKKVTVRALSSLATAHLAAQTVTGSGKQDNTCGDDTGHDTGLYWQQKNWLRVSDQSIDQSKAY